MFTRGAKTFLGLAVVAWIGALVYGVITNGIDHGGVWHVITGNGAVDALLGPLTVGYKGGVGEHIGYALLMGFAVANLGIGIAALAFRDGDAEAVAELAGTDAVPAVHEPDDLSPWPIVGGFALALMTAGLAAGWLLFAIGCLALVICGVEWTVKDWSERATGDAEVNALLRNQLMAPFELPVSGLVLIGIVAYCFSRILLASSEHMAITVATAAGALIFIVAVIIGTRQQIRRNAIVGALIVGAIAVLTLGIWGAVAGEHKEEKKTEHAGPGVTPGPNSSSNSLLGETAAS